jgi:hypothetical protein
LHLCLLGWNHSSIKFRCAKIGLKMSAEIVVASDD